MAVSFHNEDISFDLKQKSKIRLWIKRCIEKEKKKEGEINFLFTSDEVILKNNLQFLYHNSYTDIITFNSNQGNTINGDIMISIERVKENAHKFKTGFFDELLRVMIHGVYHLCSYNDKSKKEIEQMRKKEDLAINDFNKNFA